ncbi:hypothetical protein PMN41_06645, partial [Bifidobacterium longum]|nr:hypothetical protein [Bifidobacterium longum]
MAVRHRELRHPLLGAIMLGCLVMVSSATAKAVFEEWGGVPMFLSTPWGVDVSGFRLAVVGA